MNSRVVFISLLVIGTLFAFGENRSANNFFGDVVRSSPEVGYGSVSPRGEKFGLAIPASCESGYSHAGECYTPTGDPVPPDTPFDPTPQCPCSSGPNSCGLTNPGFGACGGVCPVPPPSDSSCLAPTIGGTPVVDGGGGGTPIIDQNGNLTKIINKGERCKITWSASSATSCTVTGPGVSATGVSGSIETPPLSKTSVYTIKCFNGATVSASRTFTCRLNPNYIEVGSE